MNKKSSIIKFKSIAIKLNSIFVSKMFLKFLVIDIIFIICAALLWCIEAENSYFGYIVESANRNLEFISLNEINYVCSSNKTGEVLVKNAAYFLDALKRISIVVICVEGIMLLREIVFGTQRIRKVLRPLNELAKSAERLSNMSFDESSIQNLEEAISKISPEGSSEKIHTGDRELSGIEEAINNLLERMREAYRQQARFVSDASHELRTPIAVIQGYANMLDRWGKDDEKVLAESIEAIKSESENMKNLIEQLLFLARGINGKTKVDFKEFSLSDMMKEIFEESKMIDEDHIYELKDYEEVTAYGDEGLIKETARILIENSKKYTAPGECIELSFGKVEDSKVYFSVQDNGIGMDEKDIVHIFERFFRADTSRVRKTGGTGLGLSIAKWIIDNHKGYFSVISRKDIGTRITVYIESKG